MNRKFAMQEIHQDFLDGEAEWNRPYEEDPFFNSTNPYTILGFANVYLAR